MFYKMIGGFLQDMCKYIEKHGRPCVRAHDLDGDVFIGQYGKLKMVFCCKGEFFFVVPENFQMFDASLYQQGPDFANLFRSSDMKYTLHMRGLRSHPTQPKKLLREIVSADETDKDIFRYRNANGFEYRNIGFIQNKYAKWFECLDEYYGHMTELVTDGTGVCMLRRVNGDLIAVVLEVRI